MLLTPFHLGPAFLLGFLLLRHLDFPTFLAANVVVDVRAALVLFGVLEGPLHAWPHTFLGAAVVGLLLAALALPLRARLDGLVRAMGIHQRVTTRKVVLAALAGTAVHVAVDALHHPLLEPFAPALAGNPLLVASTLQVRLVALACLLASYPVFLAYERGRPDLSDAGVGSR